MTRPLRARFDGWRIIAALACTETVSFGIVYYAFTVFIDPMRADLGWSTAVITGAFSLGLVVSGVMAPVVGRWVDRHGARGLMTAGSLAASVGLVLWSQVQTPFGFYLAWLWLGAASAMILYEPAFAVVAVWFERRRATALTLLTFVAGFASVIFIPLAAYLEVRLGWRDALLGLAAIQFVATTPLHALVVRRRPADLGQHVDGDPGPATAARHGGHDGHGGSASASQAFATRTFTRLAFAFTASVAVVVGLGVHLVPLLVRRGLDPLEAAAVAGAIGLVALPGRLVFTPLGDRLHRGRVTASIFVLQAAGLATLVLLPGDLGVWGFVLLYGAGFGAIMPARAALVADAFGPASFGAISGRITLVGTAARAAAPLMLGLVVSVGVPDQVSLLALAALTLSAAVAVAPTGRAAPRPTRPVVGGQPTASTPERR